MRDHKAIERDEDHQTVETNDISKGIRERHDITRQYREM